MLVIKLGLLMIEEDFTEILKYHNYHTAKFIVLIYLKLRNRKLVTFFVTIVTPKGELA